MKEYRDGKTCCEYKYKYCEEIPGIKLGIVVDLDSGGRSVTNFIESVANQIGVDKIVYRDSMGIWDFWNIKIGFMSLSGDEPCKDLKEAIENLKKILERLTL